jgi:16S rRNA (uracil1498-N3)-methyltransferase
MDGRKKLLAARRRKEPRSNNSPHEFFLRMVRIIAAQYRFHFNSMSRLPRFFISPDQAADETFIVSGEDVRHIGTVLRMQPGDELVLCDGTGTDYRVRITTIGRNEIRTVVLGRERREPSVPRITLGQGLPKSDKMDLIVQKSTELGVSSIVPLVTERTIVKVRDEEKRLGRWRRISREAAMQSNRSEIPLITPLRAYEAFVKEMSEASGGLLLLPWEEGTEPLRQVLRKAPPPEAITVLIGPEGGFSAGEAELAMRHGFHAVSLGRNILRTETAAVAVLAMIAYEYF